MLHESIPSAHNLERKIMIRYAATAAILGVSALWGENGVLAGVALLIVALGVYTIRVVSASLKQQQATNVELAATRQELHQARAELQATRRELNHVLSVLQENGIQLPLFPPLPSAGD